MGSPLISVVVLYYKRKDTITDCIESILRQDYSNREIILVDNHSEDGLGQLVKARGYPLRYIELPENRGACGGRNAGIREARGEILAFLEDDALFRSSSELGNIVKAFSARSDVHVLAFKICDPETGALRLREWCHPCHWKDHSESEFETHWFGEGASAFRREVFEVCGGYYEPFFYGAESDDLVIRILNQGFKILYTPRVEVGHRASETGRSSERQFYYFTRNYIWTAFKNYTLLNGARYLAVKLMMMGFFALRSGQLASFSRGLWDGARGAGKIKQDRACATPQTVKYLAKLESQRPSLAVRLARHREVPQL